jgi:hypothetical protein
MALDLTTRVCVTAIKRASACAWWAIWKHTLLLLSMTYMHDEVWFPFLMSMISVIMLVGLVYLPNDTGNAYIPKQHRKWSQYRNVIIAKGWKRIMASSIARQVETFMYTNCHHRLVRSSLCNDVLVKGTIILVRKFKKVTHRIWKTVICWLDQSEQGRFASNQSHDDEVKGTNSGLCGGHCSPCQRAASESR